MFFGKIRTIFRKITDIDEDTLFHILMAVIIVGGIVLFFVYASAAAEWTFRVWNES